MTDTELPPRLTRLTFHGPLSEARAARLVARLTRNSPRTVLDIGCGWGELMLRILAAAPDATGVGLDTNEGDLARGRDHARARGLGDRAAFVQESGVGARGDHPKADEIRAQVDQHRSFWLRGYYGLLGQAYLTLVPVG